jgi:hypothetical protein
MTSYWRPGQRAAHDQPNPWTVTGPAGQYGEMRIPWRPADYERVCSDCGHAWQVPWAAAWRRGRTVPAPAQGLGAALRDSGAAAARGTACMGRPDRLRAEVAPVLAVSRAAAELQSCPRCGAGRFSQHPVRTSAAAGR